jgi:hypothetical protein
MNIISSLNPLNWCQPAALYIVVALITLCVTFILSGFDFYYGRPLTSLSAICIQICWLMICGFILQLICVYISPLLSWFVLLLILLCNISLVLKMVMDIVAYIAL